MRRTLVRLTRRALVLALAAPPCALVGCAAPPSVSRAHPERSPAQPASPAPSSSPAPASSPVTPRGEARPRHECTCACTNAAPLELRALALPPEAGELFLPHLSTAAEHREPEPRLRTDQLTEWLRAELKPTSRPDLSELVDVCSALPSPSAPPPIHSGALRVYDVARVTPARGEAVVALLYSRYSPADIILDRTMAEWRVALVSTTGELLSRQAFVTRIPYLADWSSIVALLELREDHLTARVTYGGGCRGDKYDQTFFASFDVGENACLELLEVERRGYR